MSKASERRKSVGNTSCAGLPGTTLRPVALWKDCAGIVEQTLPSQIVSGRMFLIAPIFGVKMSRKNVPTAFSLS
jgi:hypothetical protein